MLELYREQALFLFAHQKTRTLDMNEIVILNSLNLKRVKLFANGRRSQKTRNKFIKKRKLSGIQIKRMVEKTQDSDR